MEKQDYGKELSAIRTVFMYRVNVALAAFLIFFLLQTFVNTLIVDDVPPNAPLIFGLLLWTAIVYGFFSLNGMLTKITIFENGLEYKSLLRRRFVQSDQIKKVDFHRKDKLRMKITLHTTQGNPMIINAAKYKENQPLIDFCTKFERS